ncbi:hypothetical protein TNCV_2586011 [Trichonephila clavipes]|nr:hypothetical protein TNCV_2586011 [Trichonephila clavipes]
MLKEALKMFDEKEEMEEFIKDILNKPTVSEVKYGHIVTGSGNTVDASHLFPEANQEIVSRTLNMEPPNKKIKTQRYVSTKKTSQKTSTTLRKPIQKECQSVSTSLVVTAKSV